MAWDPLGDDEYSGDAPMDAFGAALADAAEKCRAKLGRLPRTAEIVQAFAEALASAAAGTVLDPGAADARLAPLRRAGASARRSPKRQRVTVGDVLAIPYAGESEIYGWVIFVPDASARLTLDLGVCVVVLDRDVRAGDDLTDVVRSEILLGPLHPNDREIREGLWRIVGNVAGAFEALVPRFQTTKLRGTKMVRVLVDYAGDEVEDTPENRARVRPPSVGGAQSVMHAARALRGEARWRDGFAEMLAAGRSPP